MNQLSKLIAKYVDDDDPQHALEVVAQTNFELMKEYADGVPAGVMFAASTTANERIAVLLAGMILDVMKIIQNWDDKITAEQEGLTRAMIMLISADSLRDTLVALRPMDEVPDDESP